MPVNKYFVNFFDANGKCYFRDTAVHVDVTKYCTIIDFERNPLSNESGGLFRAFDELQRLDCVANMFKLTYLSGQTITICRC